MLAHCSTRTDRAKGDATLLHWGACREKGLGKRVASPFPYQRKVITAFDMITVPLSLDFASIRIVLPSRQ